MLRDGNFLNAFVEKTIKTIRFPNKPNESRMPHITKFKLIEYILNKTIDLIYFFLNRFINLTSLKILN